jgi:hypothetical protein
MERYDGAVSNCVGLRSRQIQSRSADESAPGAARKTATEQIEDLSVLSLTLRPWPVTGIRIVSGENLGNCYGELLPASR